MGWAVGILAWTLVALIYLAVTLGWNDKSVRHFRIIENIFLLPVTILARILVFLMSADKPKHDK